MFLSIERLLSGLIQFHVVVLYYSAYLFAASESVAFLVCLLNLGLNIGAIIDFFLKNNYRKETPIPPKQCCFRCCFGAEMHLQHPPMTSRPNINIGLGEGGLQHHLTG